MYCGYCGKQTAALRCPGCHRFSLAGWLGFFTLVACLAIVAFSYAFMHLMGWFALFYSEVAISLPRIMELNLAWYSFLWTCGTLILVVVLALVARLIKSYFKSPRLGEIVTGLSTLGLLLVAVVVVVDVHSLDSFALGLVKSFEELNVLRSELKGRDATRRVMVAEYRYRDLHAKEGFTCNMESLEPLGGLPKSDYPHNSPKYIPANMARVDIYIVTLGACQGIPVTKYELSTVPDHSFGLSYDQAIAYCSDGSGALYSAADGKSETCLAARRPLP